MRRAERHRSAARTGNVGWAAIEPPPPGVTDSRFSGHQRLLASAARVMITVTAVDPTEWEERWSITAMVGTPDRSVAIRGKVPHYAAGQVVVGADLPAGIGLDGTVLIDWSAVALSSARGHGAVRVTPPPAPPPAPMPPPSAAPGPYQFASRADAKEFQAWLKLRVMRKVGVPESAVSSTMRKSGISPDEWPAIDRVWMQRCQSNPALAEQLRLAGR